jgi:hypothetical protein
MPVCFEGIYASFLQERGVFCWKVVEYCAEGLINPVLKTNTHGFIVDIVDFCLD